MKTLLYFIFLIPLSYAQDQALDKAQKDPRESLLEKHFQGLEKMNLQMEKQMQEMMERMEKAFGQNLWHDHFGQFDQFFKGIPGMPQDNSSWQETSDSRILKLKIRPVKDRPLDIEMNDEQIKISGQVETQEKIFKNGQKSQQKSIVSLEQVFSTPKDVDVKKAKVSQTDEGLSITFPKVKPSLKDKQEKNGLKPLKIRPGDQVI